MLSSYLSGLSLGFSLILAIGAQNAFLLRQGLRGEHVLPICVLFTLSDALLITLGVTSFAAVSRAVPAIEPLLRWGGALFLLVYAARSFHAALGSPEALVPASGVPGRPLGPTLAVALALTFANPHVYLDAVVLIGTVSTRQPDPALFGTGAVTASAVFFFALGFGARRLRPVFARPRSWQMLEVTIGVVMTMLGLGLLVGG